MRQMIFRRSTAIGILVLTFLIVLVVWFTKAPPGSTEIRFSEVAEGSGIKAIVNGYGLAFGDMNGDACPDLFAGSHGAGSTRLYLNDCQGGFSDKLDALGTKIRFEFVDSSTEQAIPALLEPCLELPPQVEIDFENSRFRPPPKAGLGGYRVWQDLDTSGWKIRWGGAAGRYSGKITWSLPGNIRTIGLTAGDELDVADMSVEFDTTTADSAEKGLGITALPMFRTAYVITFDLRIDGEPARERTLVSELAARPWSMPFSLGQFQRAWLMPEYQAGRDVGYFMWLDQRTGNWHLRWSSDGSSKAFTGDIRVPKGRLSLVDTIAGETGVTETSKRHLQFRSLVATGESGLVFRPNFWKQQGLFSLDLKIDGTPAAVHIGYGAAVPPDEQVFPFHYSFSEQTATCEGIDKARVIVGETEVFIRDGGDQSLEEVKVSGDEPIAGAAADDVSAVREFSASGSVRHRPIKMSGFRRFEDRHGAAWGDFSNDGYQDLYISNGGGKGKGNPLGGEFWDSDAGQSFRPRAEEFRLTDPDGRGRSVAVVDFDNDGRLDIVKSNKSRPLRLYRNTGSEFVDVAAELNLAGPFGAHNPTTTSWADYDGDGDMDVLVTGKQVHLFRNDGTVFSDVTDKLPDKEICCAHAAAWGDYDNDGDPDLYLARSYGMMEGTTSANLLLRNDGNGHFTDATDESGTGSWGNSRDATWLDFDNDGDLDLYVVNSASLAAFAPWFARPTLSLWEPMLSDGVFDEANLLFQNHGDGTFTEVAEIAGVQGENSNSGVAVADVDRDGFLDLALSAGYYPLESGPILLFRNEGSANNWLRLRLIGRVSNRDAIGARVFLTSNGRKQFRSRNGGIHGFSQDYDELHFGLGTHTLAESVEILWPSGKRTSLSNLAANRVHVIREQ